MLYGRMRGLWNRFLELVYKVEMLCMVYLVAEVDGTACDSRKLN